LQKLCKNLKQLQSLKIEYCPSGFLWQLENLTELELDEDFNMTFFKVLPNLKSYKCCDVLSYEELPMMLRDLKNLTPCALEQCEVNALKTEEEM